MQEGWGKHKQGAYPPTAVFSVNILYHPPDSIPRDATPTVVALHLVAPVLRLHYSNGVRWAQPKRPFTILTEMLTEYHHPTISWPLSPSSSTRLEGYLETLSSTIFSLGPVAFSERVLPCTIRKLGLGREHFTRQLHNVIQTASWRLPQYTLPPPQPTENCQNTSPPLWIFLLRAKPESTLPRLWHPEMYSEHTFCRLYYTLSWLAGLARPQVEGQIGGETIKVM